jgi:hypothetical protein
MSTAWHFSCQSPALRLRFESERPESAPDKLFPGPFERERPQDLPVGMSRIAHQSMQLPRQRPIASPLVQTSGIASLHPAVSCASMRRQLLVGGRRRSIGNIGTNSNRLRLQV